MSFDESKVALEFRDIIAEIARKEINKQRPKHRYATVTSINYNHFKANVIYTGETDEITVSFGALAPAYVGQTVRVEGSRNKRYITDVIGPARRKVLLGSAFDNTTPTALTVQGTQYVGLIVSFSIPTQTRVKLIGYTRYLLGTATGGRTNVKVGYDDDDVSIAQGDALPMTSTFGDEFGSIANMSGVVGGGGASGVTVMSDFLLDEGNYQALLIITRFSGGASSDTASASWLRVEDLGTE
jgi:hypothetical protein